MTLSKLYVSNVTVFVAAIVPQVSPEDTDTDVTLHRVLYSPDTDFLWMRGGQRIDPNDKYDIIYSDGSMNKGQMGGSNLVSPQISALVIKNVEPSDDGNYTCFVEGTDESANVQLNINEPGKTN